LNSQRISWFWPLSFLAALGQLLLLLTHNTSGPAAARFALAAWTLWLPGVWLGNLLTKPHTGLPARLPLQVSCAMALAYILLMLRSAGVLAVHWLPLLVAGSSLAIGGVFLLLPGNRGGLRRAPRWEAREVRRADPQLMALFVAVLVGVALLGFWAGSPLSLRPDGVDQVGAARLAGRIAFGFLPPAYHDHLGLAVSDPHRSLAHGLVDLLARLSNVPHDQVWGLLPAVLSPILLLAVYTLGRVIFRNENLAVASALVYVALATAGFANDALRLAPYPDRLAQIPYWMGVSLFLDGLDRPHPRAGIALGFVALAVTGTHLGMGFLLLVVMVVVGTHTWGSVDRFLEGVPLLLVLWIPALILTGLYLGLRVAALGSVAPFQVPAQGLLVLGPGRWILDPAAHRGAVEAAAILAGVGAVTLLREAWQKVSTYYLVALTAATLLLGYNPWLTPLLERHLGSMVHLVPWLLPLPYLLVAEVEWAGRGLARSEGLTWIRILFLGATGAIAVWLGVTGINHFAYRPARVAAERAALPERYRPLARDLAAAVPEHPVILSDPVSAAAMAAYAPVRSAYIPDLPGSPRGNALHRALAGREALMERPDGFGDRTPPDSSFVGPSVGPGADHRRALLRFLRAYPAEVVVAPRLPEREHFADGWRLGPEDGPLWERWLEADSTRYHRVPLDTLGTAFLVASPPPGPGPEGWLNDRPGPLRPPASLRFPGPELVAVVPDTETAAAGETLRVTTRWRGGPLSAHPDPRGYRVRLELHAVPPGPPSWRSWLRTRWSAVTDLLSGRRHGTGVEDRLAEGRPTAWWPGEITQETDLAIPRWLVPGTYELRAAALPGPVVYDRVRRGVTFLPPRGRPVLIRLLPR
jgi:hypothetical protein